MTSNASPNHNFTRDAATKNVVTPYAFSVAEELLGKPLATPRRRLVAILIDMLVVALLTLLSPFYLAIVVLLVASKTLYSLSDDDGSGGVKLSLSLAIGGAVLVLLFQFFVSNDAAVGEVAVKATAEAAAVTSDSSFIAWLKEYLDDFGLSFGWAAMYFSVLTAWWGGQTLGKKVMGIRVVRIDARKIDLWESFGRYGGYSAGVATGFTGFLQIYWDSNRQAIQDKISETFVIRLK